VIGVAKEEGCCWEKKVGCFVHPSSTVCFNFFFQCADSPTRNVNIFVKSVAGCITHNYFSCTFTIADCTNRKVNFFENNYGLYNSQYKKFSKIHCGLYNPQPFLKFFYVTSYTTCNVFLKKNYITGCITTMCFWNFFILRILQSLTCFDTSERVCLHS